MIIEIKLLKFRRCYINEERKNEKHTKKNFKL